VLSKKWRPLLTGDIFMSDDMFAYFSGMKLYGDDFSPDQIAAWFRDEQEAYAALGAGNRQKYEYAYHQLNIRHGYRHIGSRRFRHALGFGSAYGDEFLPVIRQIDFITILDPSEAFSKTEQISGVPCEYHKPNIDGGISFADGNFDFIACLGVMHHIANVSRVVNECFRCLSTDGVMLLREPIVSMGDWRKPRTGLTKRERGIPIKIFEQIIEKSGFTVKHKAFCNFPPIPRLASKIGVDAYNSPTLTWLDDLLSQIFSRNTQYHREGLFSKFGPASAYFILGKE